MAMNEGANVDGPDNDKDLVDIVHEADIGLRGSQVLEVERKKNKEGVPHEEKEIGQGHEIVDGRKLFHGSSVAMAPWKAIPFSVN